MGDEYVYSIVSGMVSWLLTSLQTHPIVYNKYGQLFVCQSYLSRVIFKKHFCPTQSVLLPDMSKYFTVSYSDLNFLNVAYPDLFYDWKLKWSIFENTRVFCFQTFQCILNHTIFLISKVAPYNIYTYRHIIHDTNQPILWNSSLVKTGIKIPVTILETTASYKQSI